MGLSTRITNGSDRGLSTRVLPLRESEAMIRLGFANECEAEAHTPSSHLIAVRVRRVLAAVVWSGGDPLSSVAGSASAVGLQSLSRRLQCREPSALLAQVLPNAFCVEVVDGDECPNLAVFHGPGFVPSVAQISSG